MRRSCGSSTSRNRLIGGSDCDSSAAGNGIVDVVSVDDLASIREEDVNLGRSGSATGAVVVVAVVEADGGVSGALRPNPRIIPGMWLRGLKVFPKFFIDSNGVVTGLGLKMEAPAPPGLGEEVLLRRPVGRVLAL